MARAYKTIFQKLCDVTQPWCAKYIIWYFTHEETGQTFAELKKSDATIKTEELCKEWLTREDVQNALKIYMKHMKTYNMMQIYYKMLDKAMEGDTNAAKWVESFSNSKFFVDETDEIDDFLNGVNIPALKGGGHSGTK